MTDDEALLNFEDLSTHEQICFCANKVQDAAHICQHLQHEKDLETVSRRANATMWMLERMAGCLYKIARDINKGFVR